MLIVARAPGRAGIIGNPTDGYGGAVLACSIENTASATIEPADKLILQNSRGSVVLQRTSDFTSRGDYFDIPRAVLRCLNLEQLRAKITIHTTVPEQAGLAGSTAVIAAVLSALLAFTGRSYHKYQLAELNRTIELNYLNNHCGYQDAYMTTFGGLNYMDFRGKEHYQELHLEQYATVEPLHSFCSELPFVIAHTGVQHHSGSFHRPLRERWLKGEPQVVKGYREIAEIAREGKKALLNRDWPRLGFLMNENHRIQDALSFSGEQNNYMIKVARENGALGAKLAGAGGGGTIIALTLDPSRTRQALERAGATAFVNLDPGSPGVTVTRLEQAPSPLKNIRSTPSAAPLPQGQS